jgi:hypothetical protein
VIKRSGQNTVTRLFHAKNDKETIAAWRLELNRILHVFSVRPAISAWSSLTVNLQTELAVTTHVTVSDIRHGVVDTRAIVSGIRDDVSKIREGIGGHVQAAQTRSAASTTKKFHILHSHLAHPESRLHRHRGPVSDATG